MGGVDGRPGLAWLVAVHLSLLVCATASDTEICRAERKPGPCRGDVLRWFFDGEECVKFRYGGCRGNKNNFETKEACEQVCMVSTGEVRCLCNVPPCVSTGYMCKSALGACFSEVRRADAPAGPGAPLHGCLDMLDSLQRDACSADGSMGPGLTCCRNDMCNHAGGWLHSRRNHSALAGAVVNGTALSATELSPSAYATGEVWLKAATIAVPVCGAVILVALVAAAVRILRRDAREQAAAYAACTAGRCKAPLLPTSHHHHQQQLQGEERRPDKNEANARLNRTAAHANLFCADEVAASDRAPTKLYHKAAIAWHAEPCSCPI